MVTVKSFREMALAFDRSEELPHFEKTSFRVNKKIFATLSEKTGIACLMLTPVDQSVFCLADPDVIYPVPNKWGKSGATFVNLSNIKKAMLKDALQTAYSHIAQKK